MKKLLLLLFLIPNLVMAEKVSLVCEGISSQLSPTTHKEISAMRTYIIDDEKLLKAEELMTEVNHEWFCRWSESEIYCRTKPYIDSSGEMKSGIGGITIDRLSGSLKSMTEVGSLYLDNFIATCKVITKNKF